MINKSKIINTAFKKLGTIDKQHESGKITKHQHDIKSKKVLKDMMK